MLHRKSEVTSGLPELSPDLLEVGAHLVAAIVNWPDWCHRKVESFDLLQGRRGRRRVSIDCSPRSITWTEPGSSFPGALVPLTYMTKATLRDFDVRDDQGAPVPILGSEANGLLAASAIAFLLSIQHGEAEAAERWSDICRVTFGTGDEAEAAAGELIMAVNPDVVTAALIRDLARNFLLVAVIPPASGDKRQILKYSYHWETKDPGSSGWTDGLWAGLGFTSFAVELEMNALDSARSYHLECSAPSGLLCDRVELPLDSSGSRPIDAQRTPVGHAHGRYGWEEAKNPTDASVSFVIDPSGLPLRVIWSAVAVTLIFASLLLVPNAYSALTLSVDAATALLLFVPALLIALGAKGPENDIVSRLLRTLRSMAYALSLLLYVAGAVLVVKAPEALVKTVWIGSAGFGLLIFLTVVSGVARLNVSGKK